MSRQSSNSDDDAKQRHRALSRWDNEGWAGPDGDQIPVPEITNSELVLLRVRVIALENLIISLLAAASDQQLALAREMAGYISPRTNIPHHPLTTRAATHMIDLVELAATWKRLKDPEKELKKIRSDEVDDVRANEGTD